MITGTTESKTLRNHIPCKCKCRYERKKYNSNQWWNKNKCWYDCKEVYVCEKDYICNPATCICENGKYLAIIMDDLAIIFDKVIASTTKN